MMNSSDTPATGSNQITMPTNNIGSWDTLDEPIWNTIHRDLFNIYSKLKYVLLPVSENDIYLNVCKNWDLWGPFIFYAFIAFATNSCNPEICAGYHQSNFSSTFVLMWIANFIISMNYKFLLRNLTKSEQTSFNNDLNQLPTKRLRPMSLFQLLCLFGYSMAIPSIGIFSIKISSLLFGSSFLFVYEKFLIIVVFCLIYPIMSCARMLSTNISNEKYFLFMYPIFLFFFILSLYIHTFV